MKIAHQNSLRLTMQCIKWNSPTPFKGGYKRSEYCTQRERKTPTSVLVYRPDPSGELYLAKRVSVRKDGSY